MKKLVYGLDSHSTLTENSQTGKRPPGLTLKVDSKIKIAHGHLTAKAELQNSASEPAVIALFGEDPPFNLSVSEENGVHLRWPGRPSAAKPTSRTLVVPAKSTVLFEKRLPLGVLFYKGTPAARVRWNFAFAESPERGEIRFKLPRRLDKTSYFIQGKLVPESEYKKFEKTLTGQTDWYCDESASGGQTGWKSKNPDGGTFKVTQDHFDGWSVFDIEPL